MVARSVRGSSVNLTAPGPIGSVTPSTGAFTTLSATGLTTLTPSAANQGLIASTGYSLTGSNTTSMISLAGTLNTSGANFNILSASITNTAVGTGVKFLNLLAGAGGVTSMFSVDLSGDLTMAGGLTSSADGIVYSSNGGFAEGFNVFYTGVASAGGGFNVHRAANLTAPSASTLRGALRVRGVSPYNLYFNNYYSSTDHSIFEASGANNNTWFNPTAGNMGVGMATTIAPAATLTLVNAGTFGFDNGSGTIQAFLTSPGSANWQFGAANAASPVAQTISFQGARPGTDTNTASVNTTWIGSLGTGTGTNGNTIFQVGVKVGSGAATATATTALTLAGETLLATFAGNALVQRADASNPTYVTSKNTAGHAGFLIDAFTNFNPFVDLNYNGVKKANFAVLGNGTYFAINDANVVPTYINANGQNVGIGAAAATSTLTVTGTFNVTSNATFGGTVTVPGVGTAMITSTGTFTSGAGASVGTLTNAPSAGNPTTWIKVVDNGVTRFIPAW